MSTTTVSIRSTSRAADLAAVRRRQAEARAAARRARQRALEERRQEEAKRQRIALAHELIGVQESRFEALVTRADEAARRLPDLALQTPTLESLDSRAQQDPAALEAHVARLTAHVNTFAHQLDAAVAEAERLLARRIATAAAWRRAADLEQQIQLLTERVRQAASGLGVDPVQMATPTRPSTDAALETVEAFVVALTRRRDALDQEDAKLRARAQSRERAKALGGAQVDARGADQILGQYADEQRARAAAALAAHRDAELARHGLRLDQLPRALRARLAQTLTRASEQDWRDSVSGWIAREQQQRADLSRALDLMQRAPDLVHADAGLSRRWASLTGQLQRIASGLEPFTPSVEREYAQIGADAGRLVNAAFSRADWVQAMSEQGFEVLERVDGDGLVVVDLDHPEVWLEANEYEDEGGAFAATLELMTDVAALAEEATITDAVCGKLAHAAASGAPEVATQAEVIEHERRIKRAHRPILGRKAFAQTL